MNRLLTSIFVLVNGKVFKVNRSVYIAKSGQQYDKTLNNFLKYVPNHVIKDMYMLNYGIMNSVNSLYHISIEVLIDFINSVITLHVFYKQLNFLLQPRVTYGRMNFKSESCLGVAYSVHIQPLVAQFLRPGRLIFKCFFFLLYMSASSLCLFSIRQLKELLPVPRVSS